MKLPVPLLQAGLTLAVATAAAGQMNTQPRKQPNPPQRATHAASPDKGQQVFEQNCSRCHNPPEGFGPSISGTIAMHMRVRANLSEEDYKALLRFLNP